MLRNFRLLNLRRLRRQPLRAALAVLAVSAGVSLGVSVVVLSASTTRSLNDFARRLAGPAPLRVIGATSRGGLDESVLGLVERTPGVSAAIPVVQAVTYAEGGRGQPTVVVAFGVDCRVQALIGPLGCSDQAVARATDTSSPIISGWLARRLGPGAVIRTDLGRTAIDPSLSGRALDRMNGGHVVVFPLPVAQRLFDRPQRLDTIYVIPRPHTDVGHLRATRARYDRGGCLLDPGLLVGQRLVATAHRPPPSARNPTDGAT